MKKCIYIVVPIFLFVAIFLSSCGDGAVKDFATDFATKVSKNQVDSVRALYADAAGCDSFALNFVPDSMTIEEISDGMYKVSLGSADFTVSKADDGQMTVKESHGLFAYPAEKLDFAKSTGQYDSALSDAKNADRMEDECFMKYLNTHLKEQSQNALVIVSKRGANYGEGEGGIRVAGNYLFVVQNTTDNTIPGSAYQLIVTTKDWDIESLRDTYSSRRLPGKDLGPGEQTTFACRAGTFGTSAKINYIGADQSTLLSNFKPTGNEYAEYLAKTDWLLKRDGETWFKIVFSNSNKILAVHDGADCCKTVSPTDNDDIWFRIVKNDDGTLSFVSRSNRTLCYKEATNGSELFSASDASKYNTKFYIRPCDNVFVISPVSKEKTKVYINQWEGKSDLKFFYIPDDGCKLMFILQYEGV